MDLQTFCGMTDVTAIGYGLKDINPALDHPLVKRICVDSPSNTLRAWRKGLRTSAVFNFPFGQPSGSVRDLIDHGAQELDIPIPLSSIPRRFDFRSYWPVWGPWLDSLSLPAHAGITFKIILHTDYIEKTCDSPIPVIKRLADEINQIFRSRYPGSLDLVFKTSTGYGPGGATPEAVKALAEEGYKVKASGGIRTKAKAEELFGAGAALFGIGFSSFLAIVNEFGGEQNGNNEQAGDQRSNY